MKTVDHSPKRTGAYSPATPVSTPPQFISLNYKLLAEAKAKTHHTYAPIARMRNRSVLFFTATLSATTSAAAAPVRLPHTSCAYTKNTKPTNINNFL